MKWIKCSDRLPEAKEECLLLYDDNKITHGHLCDPKAPECYKWQFTVSWNGWESTYNEDRNVTHWMPLSEIPLPKEENRKDDKCDYCDKPCTFLDARLNHWFCEYHISPCNRPTEYIND